MKSLLISATVVLGLALYKFLLGELVKTRPGLTAIVIIISFILLAVFLLVLAAIAFIN
jgi:hypothetical protein